MAHNADKKNIKYFVNISNYYEKYQKNYATFMQVAVMAHNVDQSEIGVWQHLIPA